MAERQTLLLVEIPEPLRGRVERTFHRVWAGSVRLVSKVDDDQARLAVTVRPTLDEALSVVRAQRASLPWLVVGEGARQARNQRGQLPAEVPWALTPDELTDPRLVALAVRLTLEVSGRRRGERQLQAALGLAELGAAVGGVAHELGNPLTGLLTNLELARMALADDAVSEDVLAELRANVSDALEGARHLARVAGDLSRASSRSGRLATVDVRAIVDTAVRLARPSLQQVEVRRSAHRPALARVDEGRLCQVLVNLLKNAGEALRGRERGVVEVEVDVDADAGLGGRERVLVRVSDNGPGVQPALAARLFQPYTTSRTDGTGLGLALSRRYLTEMGGGITLADSSARGSTFELWVPAAAAGDAVRPTLVPDLERGRFRVLVLDDNALIRRSILRALSPPHEVTAVATAEEALALLGAERFDVLIVDVDLDGRRGEGSGIDFHRALQTRHRAAAPAVVFVSGDYDDEALAYIERHQLAWIRKPFGAEDVRHLVSELTANPRPRRASRG
ncbi:MAG: ATP-binding protein [Myxococcota bacterium]